LDRFCFCDRVEPHQLSTRLVLIRHRKEQRKPSNSGRVVARALTNTALVSYDIRDTPMPTDELKHPDTWLLFPEGAPTTADKLTPLPRRLVVIDATWRQARRMRRNIGDLRGMPVLCLPPPDEIRFRIRAARPPAYQSTAEAVAGALVLLGEHSAARHILELFGWLVQGLAAPSRRPIVVRRPAN